MKTYHRIKVEALATNSHLYHTHTHTLKYGRSLTGKREDTRSNKQRPYIYIRMNRGDNR